VKKTLYSFIIYIFIIVLSSLAEAQGAGYALQFDGVNDYVNVAASASLNITSAITIEAWVKKFANVEWSSVITKGKPPANVLTTNYSLHFASTGGLIFTGDSLGQAKSSLTFPLNEWHHVAVTWDGSVIKFYIDGMLDSLRTPFTRSLIPNNLDLTIGADFPGDVEYFSGQLDEVRLWNIGRTQQQIKDNMHLKLTGSEVGLVGYWRFDEGSGTNTNDVSGHGNNGILVNNPYWVLSGVVFVSVKELSSKIMPETFTLFQNFPNPFNPTTSISFSLPLKSFVSIKIFDLIGREVAIIVSEELSAGSYSRTWNATTMSSGIYFYRLHAGSFTETKKLVLLR
jgi:hypothetical protein